MKIVSVFAILNLIAFFLVWVLAIIFFVALLFYRGMSPKWIVRYINKRIFVNEEFQYPVISKSVEKIKTFPLPISLIYQLILTFLLGLVVTPFILIHKYPGILAVNAGLFCFTIGGILVFFSGRLHIQVNPNRKLKYELFTTGMMTILAGMNFFSIITPEIYSQLNDRHPADILESAGAEMFVPFFMPLIMFAFFGGTLTRVMSRFKTDNPSKVIRLFYQSRLLFNPLIWIGIVSFNNSVLNDRGATISYMALLIAIVLPIRYLAVEYSRNHPIIYLRSFHYRNSPLVLSRIVLPSVLHFAPVLAVTHKLQPPEDIYSKTSLFEQSEIPSIYNVSNEKWQKWITQCFSKASAIIIDCSVQSPGVMWELDLAKKILPKERIIIIQNIDSGAFPNSELPSINYELGSYWKFKKARKKLEQYLKKAFSSPYRIKARMEA